MKFSEPEMRFLRQENATLKLKPMADLRAIGCPQVVFEKILEERARKLGGEWARFRDEHKTPATQSSQPDLDARIAAARLF